MIKRSKKETGGPKAVVPPSAEFFAKLAPTTSAPVLAPAKKVPSTEASDALKRIGTGWDTEMERLLNLPPQLFRMEMDTGVFFSDDDKFGLSIALSSSQAGALKKPPSDYGIALYGSGTSTYFFLMDMGRGIIVHERIINFHDEASEKDWSAVKTSIKDALALAATMKAGKEVAVCRDGIARVMSIVA